ncbi:MAG: histidine kinase, partial [Betaproteobacteria bacterium]|nr:histidine kinase [Betaproteobacteria bacterium]
MCRNAARSSIKQNTNPDVLPDFRNLGVIARILVAVNVPAFMAVLYFTSGWGETIERFVHAAAFLEPLLLISLVLLYGASRVLARLPYARGAAAILLIELVLATALYVAWPASLGGPGEGLDRALILTALSVAALLGYFRLFNKAYSPALAEARLQALQARIRPHFLFNSLNAVLSLVRREPRRAERALEDLADLFRTLMSDARQFVRLEEEISLIERYAGLEQLRLGERLRITWEIDNAPSDALMPALVLQPLLENAVYHGVEPGIGIGDILVKIERRADRVFVRIENPFIPESQARTGNHIALDNLRERLTLFFDAEARIETRIVRNCFQVDIEMPYVTSRPGR